MPANFYDINFPLNNSTQYKALIVITLHNMTPFLEGVPWLLLYPLIIHSSNSLPLILSNVSFDTK